jgi:uncharacterized repeat protein (TIGR03803 family)
MRTLDAFGKCILASGIATALLALSGTAHAMGYRILYTFCTQHCNDGSTPNGMIRDSAGNLYGTTAYGGVADRGVVFKLAADGTETILHDFCAGNCSDGGYPSGGVIKDSAGNLYGTAGVAGRHDGGLVFKLPPPPIPTPTAKSCSIIFAAKTIVPMATVPRAA